MAFVGAISVAFGAAELQEYVMPGYVMGGADVDVSSSERPQVTATPQLVFANATLDEIRNLTFCGLEQNLNNNGPALSYFTHDYTDANGVLQFLVVTVQKLDYKNATDSHIKAVTVKLTQKPDGVWAERVNGPYFTTPDATLVPTRDFVAIGDNGTIGFVNNTGTSGYSLRSLCALTPIPTDVPAIAFANPAGGTTLTVDDIKNYNFTGIIVGPSVSRAYTRRAMQNKYVTYEGSVATKIRLELQVLDGQTIRCAVVELTNGAGGVYAKTVKACSRGITTAGVSFGDPFLKPDGTFAGSDIVENNLGTIISGDCGAASLTATYASARTFVLDGSKTWSQLAGSSSPVDDATLDVTIEATVPNATLTFDVPVNVHSFVLSSSSGSSVTFAVASGVAAPTAGMWNLRGTTGNITFAGFSPAQDDAAANINPNAASTLTFAGDVNGVYPFNNAPVMPPYKALVLAGEQSFPTGFSFSKLNSLSEPDSLLLGGDVGGTGVITLAENGVLVLTNTVTIADTVTVTNAANAAIPLKVRGAEPASFTMNGKTTAGGFVLTEGTLKVAADTANEDDAAIGAGGTLNIVVTDVMKKSGYTTTATVLEGGVVRFFDAAGTELGVGRPVMTVLPGTDATWTAGSETGDLDDAARWSSLAVPADDGDVALSSGTLPRATAVISAYRSYRQVSIQSSSDIVLTREEGTSATFTIGTLAVAPHAKVTIELPATICSAIQLGDDSELRIVGSGEDIQGFGAVISGTGKVSYCGGKVRINKTHSYTGGTYIKAGALAQFGLNGSVFGNTGKPLVIEAGGALDTNGSYDSQYNPTVAGDGVLLADGKRSGAIFNSKAGSVSTDSKAQYQSLTVTAPTTLSADNVWGFVRGGHNGNFPLNLGTNTLTKIGKGDLYFATKNNVQVTGTGTIAVEEGKIIWAMKNGGGTADCFSAANAPLLIGTNGTFEAHGTIRFRDLTNNGTLFFNMAPRGADITDDTPYYGDGDVIIDGNIGKSVFFRSRSTSKSTISVRKGRYAVINSSGNNSAYKFVTPENPKANLKIVVEPGAQFDLNGVKDFNPTVVISGSLNGKKGTPEGALVNRADASIGSGSAQIPQIILAGDALVSGYASKSDFGLVAPGHNETRLELGSYTMTLNTAAQFWMINTTIMGTGTLCVTNGTLHFLIKAMRGNDWSLETKEGGIVNFDGVSVTCSNLVWRGTAQGNKGVTAYGTYKPVSTTLPAVVLAGPAAGIDASGMTAPWNIATGGGLTFAAGTKVNVDLGERPLSSNLKILAWDRLPTNVQLWTMTPASPKFRVTARDDGLYIIPHNFIIYVR